MKRKALTCIVMSVSVFVHEMATLSCSGSREAQCSPSHSPSRASAELAMMSDLVRNVWGPPEGDRVLMSGEDED